MDLEKVQEELYTECHQLVFSILSSSDVQIRAKLLEVSTLRKVINRIKTNKYE